MQIIQDYRSLHRIPEPDNRLPKTLAFLRSRLFSLKCRCFSPAEGALCAFFDFGCDRTLAFRADLDALPLTERTSLPWASQHPGYMHACGHDGHTAILLELARKLHKTTSLHHNVLLVFQPAEETEGGARLICPVLKEYRVSAIFALHLWPGLPKGQLFSRPGLLMAHTGGVTVRFRGKSVHITQNGQDALNACICFYQAAKQIPCFLKFGKLNGGTAGNILCEEAVLWGSLRTTHHRAHTENRLTQLMNRILQNTGCTGEILFSPGYPPVCNSRSLWEQVQACSPVQRLNTFFWTGDDFSFYQKEVPGLYFLLGIGNTPPLHSGEFQFDPAVLSIGANYFYQLCTKLV